MIAEGLMPKGQQIIVRASEYHWRFNSRCVACEIDKSGLARPLVPFGFDNPVDPPAMMFGNPAFNSSVIGLLADKVTAYRSLPGTDHAFPRAFPDPYKKGWEPAQLAIPTLLHRNGSRIYFFRVRDGRTPLPPRPPTLERLSAQAPIALPTPLRDDVPVSWEIEGPSDWHALTPDPYFPDHPIQPEHTRYDAG